MKKSHTSMSMRSGFTLVELLVVITIIVLLAVIMIPAMMQAQELARRAKCKANLKSIAEVCIVYMNTDNMHRNSSMGKGLPRNDPAPTSASQNPASLWLLIHHKLIARDSFLCPSAYINLDFRAPLASATAFSSNTLSYSYLSQVAFTDKNPEATRNGTTEVKITSSLNPGLKAAELAIIADANPQSSASSGPDRNSRNHKRAGQNVAFLTGNVAWFSTPDIPGTNPLSLSNGALDDIYKSCGSGGQGKRGAINDAYLVP